MTTPIEQLRALAARMRRGWLVTNWAAEIDAIADGLAADEAKRADAALRYAPRDRHGFTMTDEDTP